MDGLPSDALSHATPRASCGFDVGDYVWSPCTRTGFRRSTIVSIDAVSDSFFVESRDDNDPASGGQFHIRRSDVRPFFDSGPDRTFEDNTSMVHLDDANILDNIRRRFMRDHVYTYTANVLLAVNPYKRLPHLYGPDRMLEYRSKNVGAMPPHPYAIADAAYRHLLRERRDQALVISGESGAGKTETAKITMHYLTHVSRTDAAHGGRIQEKIVNANPILESFGNASTVRNMNSSRFGKYNEMCFNPVGSLIGARVKTYLLEASRVVSQQEGERNYHVFYEMLFGLEDDMLDKLCLDPCTKYRLLYTANAQPWSQDAPDAQRHSQQFEELRKALSTFVSPEVEQDIWECVAALIHLGEVEFRDLTSGDEGEATSSSARSASPMPGRSGSPSGADATESSQQAKVEIAGEHAQDALVQAADLLGLSESRLEQVLKMKEMHVKRQNRRTSHINCPRTKAQATQTLQSIIKILYKRLFDKIVEHINKSSASNTRGGADAPLGTAEVNYNSIGTLDIYGFERLHVNSFEQLCINLANERLQQFFIEEVLEAEQRTYAEERLNICRWQLPDNQPVVKSIQAVMQVLDEHSLRSVKNLVGSGEDKDVRFCEHVHRTQIKGAGPVMALKLKASRSGSGPAMHDGFQIRHYAGDVSYSTSGWIDKNNDALVPEVEALLGVGAKPLVRGMADIKQADVQSGERLHSVSRDYLTNLENLLGTLKTSSVHYIRCFNPNQSRRAGHFDAKYVLDQVIQCGTVELVKIMHHGFPHRCFLQDLRKRFTSLLPEDFGRYSDRDFVWAIMLAFEIDESQWTLGTKRLFLKAGQLRTLENLRDLGSTASTQIIWKIRMQFARKKVRAWCSVICLMAWWPMHRRRQRRLLLIDGVRKAAHVLVRLHRWLGKVREKLYGVAPTISMAHSDLAMHQHGLTYCLPGVKLALRGGCRVAPQLFVALNSNEERHNYASYMQNDIDTSKVVHDDVLRMWQKNTTESVLLYDGRSVLSARLNPKAFLRQPGSHLPADMAAPGRSLEDVRQIDVHDTAHAFPVAERRWDDSIICMCQHKMDKQTFATCDADNRIVIWRWAGTESDTDKPAIKPLGGIFVPSNQTIFHMTFLSEVPQRIAKKNGFVLITISAEADRHWFDLTIWSVYLGISRVECVVTAGVYSDLLPSLRQSGVQISFFTTSHTDRILVLGGRGLLQFWAIDENAEGKLSLSLIEDMAQIYAPRIKHNTMVSCLCLPPPLRSNEMLDWIVVGDATGTLYGFRFDAKEDGRISVNPGASGRFRGNTHTEGVPVRKLVAVYGSSPFAHHRAVQAKGVPYGVFLNRAPVEEKGFYSVGEDGKILSWKFRESIGWACNEEISIRSLSSGFGNGWGAPSSNGFISAHSSRLVPNIMVVVDQDRKLLMCYDRTKPNELPADAVVQYA